MPKILAIYLLCVLEIIKKSEAITDPIVIIMLINTLVLNLYKNLHSV